MKSYLHQLENNEAILLMYLANELPAQDRADVEQMLASDAGMRAELESLGELHEVGIAAMVEIDRGAEMPVSEAAAVRQVMRMVYKRQAESRNIVVPAAEPERSFPWWRYSLTAAAILLIGLLVWWGMHPGDITPPAQDREASTDSPASDYPQNSPNPNWNNGGPHELTAVEKMVMLRRSFDSSMYDDVDNMQLVVVNTKTEDADINLDPSRFSSNP
jgi:hypothetical protein